MFKALKQQLDGTWVGTSLLRGVEFRLETVLESHKDGFMIKGIELQNGEE